ncbi:YhgE/Pip domain-containing protein [Rummeliibacillus sp. NPDC094406]|uniref:YhgE/Pip domain-containing protein n=1 Tax=Rummeliibacillus sp. NPDC094406 TaxID=3364511 RepID=UPI003806A5CC
MKNYKFLILAPIVALVLIFIFSCTQIPTAHQAPKNLKIALVNEDQGVGKNNMGETISKGIQQASEKQKTNDEPMIKWVNLKNQDEMQKGMDDQSYYGAIVIPADFSKKYMSLQSPSPVSPEMKLVVNQGKNANIANIVNQALNGIVDQLNGKMSGEILGALQAKNVKLSVEQAKILTAPITKNTVMIHPTGTLGNAPLSLFQPLWFGSLIGAVLIFLSVRKRIFNNQREELMTRLLQLFVSLIIGVVAGFGLSWFATSILDYDFPSFIDTALFLTLTSWSFTLMIFAVLSWIGFAGIPIFVLLLFFGIPLLQMTPEVMPAFYKDLIYPWLPMRFMTEGLRELFFFDDAIRWNTSTIVLAWIAGVSLILSVLSVWKPKKQEVVVEESSVIVD